MKKKKKKAKLINVEKLFPISDSYARKRASIWDVCFSREKSVLVWSWGKNNKIIIWLTGLGTNATKPSFHEKPHEFGFMWISINIFHIYNSISVHSQRCSAVLHDFLMDSFSFFLIHFYSFSESHLFPVPNIPHLFFLWEIYKLQYTERFGPLQYFQNGDAIFRAPTVLW